MRLHPRGAAEAKELWRMERERRVGVCGPALVVLIVTAVSGDGLHQKLRIGPMHGGAECRVPPREPRRVAPIRTRRERLWRDRGAGPKVADCFPHSGQLVTLNHIISTANTCK